MKPALTERQQLAIVMQMTTPQKPEGGRVEAITTPGSSSKGRLHRRNERGELGCNLKITCHEFFNRGDSIT